MKYKNYLDIRKRFSFLFKYFIYVDVPQGYAINIFEQNHLHFKVMKTYISHTSDFVIIYVKIPKFEVSKFLEDMEILDKRMEICGYPDYDLFCMDFFLKFVTKMSSNLVKELKNIA